MEALFAEAGLWATLVVFVIAALVILVAGSKLESSAERIGQRSGLGQMFAGMILLAVATSLPEVATSVTATLRGNTQLAVSNLLGSVIIQTMVLALADTFGSSRALTGRAPSYGLLIQGVGLLLTLAAVAAVAGLDAHWQDIAWFADFGPALIAAIYVLLQYVTMRAQRDPRWHPATRRKLAGSPGSSHGQREASVEESTSQLRLVARFAASSATVFVAGWIIVVCTERIAAATAVSSGFFGFTLVAFTTALPEIATTLAAARRGHSLAAVSNIFGSNAFCLALLALVAALSEDSLFADYLVPAVFAATLGSMLTGVYLLGLLERRDRTVARMGWDSVAVLVLGFTGMWILFLLGS